MRGIALTENDDAMEGSCQAGRSWGRIAPLRLRAMLPRGSACDSRGQPGFRTRVRSMAFRYIRGRGIRDAGRTSVEAMRNDTSPGRAGYASRKQRPHMPDVFLSYSRENQATAQRYADALLREGFSVWWDQSVNAGEEFDAIIERALEEARAVVVLWSKSSVNSRWVRAEATQAQANRRLVPVMIEDCKRPIMFELTHTADLSGWNGDTTDPRWRVFVDGLQRFIGKSANASAGASSAAAATPVGPDAPPAARRAPRRRFGWAAGIAGLLAIAAGAFWWLHGRSADLPEVELDRTIAVLPFQNFSSDPEQDHFADGLTEEILNALTRVADLEVTARTSSFALKGKAEDLKAVGKALGVAHVLEGSVRHSGDQLRITAQLIRTETGFRLWSKSYDRPFRDIFTIQDDIARSVADALQVTLGVGVGEQPGMTRNTDAYEAWLAARGVTYTGPQSMRQHIQLLQQVVARDPDFAQPWWDLSEAYSSVLSGTSEDAAERRQKADAAFAEYRRLLPDSPRIHERLAEDAIEAGQLIIAAEQYQAAADASRKIAGGKPEQPYILGQGKTPLGFADLVGRPHESLALFEQAKARDPLNEVVSLWLAYLYGTVGDFPAAFAEFERSASLGTDVRLSPSYWRSPWRPGTGSSCCDGWMWPSRPSRKLLRISRAR